MIGDIERLAMVQHQVIKLRRLAAEIPDREISLNLRSLADKIEQRSREADRRLCSPKIAAERVLRGGRRSLR
jgi:hypothetical protein